MQHRLHFALRGPEWAFALPTDDLEALEELAARCCDFWNGANSLLIPVDEDGGLPPDLEVYLQARDVQQIFVHERLPEDRRTGLVSRFGERVLPLWPRFDEHELHPLRLQPSFIDVLENGPEIALPEPIYGDDDLRRIAIVLWGRIADEARSEFDKAFVIEQHEDEAAHFAVVDGQVSGLAPLAQSTRLMTAYEQSGPVHARQLAVVSHSFEQLVSFWNLRARAGTLAEAAVVGVPRASLATPERLRSIRDWTRKSRDALKPDVLVVADSESRDDAAAALQELGYQQTTTRRLTRYFGEVPEERREPEFALARGLLGGRMRRGVWGDQMVTAESGRNIIRIEPTTDFQVAEWSGFVHLDLINWPMAFPPTAATAKRVHENAGVDQNAITLTTVAAPRYTFDLVLPGADELLTDFLAERGLTSSLSPAGRYAQALIGRLGGPTRLDALASESALDVLEPLTSLSRPKLVQRLEAKLKEQYPPESVPSKGELAEAVREHLLAYEGRSRSLDELASESHGNRRHLLTMLETLIETGFVIRGRLERCGNCGYEEFYALGELAEQLNCRACQQDFLLAVRSGSAEPRIVYRLDPLMERAMDQDLMPVLLTLRILHSAAGAATEAFWPGLELTDQAGTKRECDILLAQDGRLTVCECKRTAAAFTAGEVEKSLAIADSLNADSVFAALEGEFSDEIRELADARRLRLLMRAQLVPSRSE